MPAILQADSPTKEQNMPKNSDVGISFWENLGVVSFCLLSTIFGWVTLLVFVLNNALSQTLINSGFFTSQSVFVTAALLAVIWVVIVSKIGTMFFELIVYKRTHPD
ncbi:hypothetical protein ACFLY0_01600 [Patescibacteria group bacterium]